MTTNPTIFFVHGAWHQGGHFQPIIKKLEADGYPAVCPTQPTFEYPIENMKTATMYEDAAFIRKELQKLIEEEEREVVVAVHSYGGIVGTEALHESLSYKYRQAEGKKGGVIKLLYMAAFLLAPGSSLGDAFGGRLPPFLPDHPDGSCTFDNPRQRFYSGLDDDTAKYWLSFTREKHPASAQLNRLTYTGYHHHPIAYLVCTEDAALNVEIQRGMIQYCKSNGLSVDVYETDADHSPWLTREYETIQVLKKCAVKIG